MRLFEYEKDPSILLLSSSEGGLSAWRSQELATVTSLPRTCPATSLEGQVYCSDPAWEVGSIRDSGKPGPYLR